MRRTTARAEVDALVVTLPRLPQPWDVGELCRELERRRKRPLRIHPMSVPGLPSGLWFYDGQIDHILHLSTARNYYRDHIILHEIAHMLAGHGVYAAGTTDPAAALEGRRYGDFEELVAERFATMVLRLAGQKRPSRFEARASAMFGAA